MVARWICDIGTFVGAFEPSSTRSRARGRMDIIIEEWFCLVYTRACELLTLVQVVHWLVSVMFLQTCLTGGVLTCLGMFVCLAQVVHWPVCSCLSKPVESSGVYFTWPTDMFISCLTD